MTKFKNLDAAQSKAFRTLIDEFKKQWWEMIKYLWEIAPLIGLIAAWVMEMLNDK